MRDTLAARSCSTATLCSGSYRRERENALSLCFGEWTDLPLMTLCVVDSTAVCSIGWFVAADSRLAGVDAAVVLQNWIHRWQAPRQVCRAPISWQTIWRNRWARHAVVLRQHSYLEGPLARCLTCCCARTPIARAVHVHLLRLSCA
eukprot:SAG31_NODE_367_length_16811_cov_20.811584_11_plen_146_part_00